MHDCDATVQRGGDRRGAGRGAVHRWCVAGRAACCSCRCCCGCYDQLVASLPNRCSAPLRSHPSLTSACSPLLQVAAALDDFADEIRGKKVVCIVSGSNNDIDRMAEIKERSLQVRRRPWPCTWSPDAWISGERLHQLTCFRPQRRTISDLC